METGAGRTDEKRDLGSFAILAISAAVTGAQIAASYYAQSAALAGDGFHELLDCVPNLIFWWTAVKISTPEQARRDRVLGKAQQALFGITAFATVAGGIACYFRPELHPQAGSIMFWAAGGAAANFLQMLVLDHWVDAGLQGKQFAWMKRHIAWDLVISLGVAASGFGSYLFPEKAKLLDSAVSVILGGLMLRHSFHSHGGAEHRDHHH